MKKSTGFVLAAGIALVLSSSSKCGGHETAGSLRTSEGSLLENPYDASAQQVVELQTCNQAAEVIANHLGALLNGHIQPPAELSYGP